MVRHGIQIGKYGSYDDGSGNWRCYEINYVPDPTVHNEPQVGGSQSMASQVADILLAGFRPASESSIAPHAMSTMALPALHSVPALPAPSPALSASEQARLEAIERVKALNSSIRR